MGNMLGVRVSRLVKENACSNGKVASLEREIATQQTELEALHRQLRTAQESVVRTKKLIAQVSSIDVATIRSIQSTPRVIEGKHGDFRREIVRLLKEAKGPVRTSGLMRILKVEFQIPFSNIEERQRAREKIRGPLRVMKKKGVIRRLP
jgi:hypothetical protein